MPSIPDSSHDGFTLIETVVATGILITTLVGIAQLLALSIGSTRDGGVQGAALIAAQDKIEELRSLAFTYGPLSEPITAAGLAPASGQSLAEDTPGFVDLLDHEGGVVAGEVRGAAFTRRWRITAIDHLQPEALAVEVCVFRWPAMAQAPLSADVCLATVRARQP